jgi:hypothetical protein
MGLRRVVPDTGTIVIMWCCARVVLFRTVLVPAHRDRAKWMVCLPRCQLPLTLSASQINQVNSNL